MTSFTYESRVDEFIDETIPDDEVVVETGFGADYAAPTNYGTDSHWPPLTPMVEWTNRMGWENYGLESSMSEDALWNAVDERQVSNQLLPAAYLLAAHIAENGTEGLQYASDAFTMAIRQGEPFVRRQDYDANTSLERVAIDVANWTFSTAQENLAERVSRASTGTLLQSGIPPQVVEE